jgi:tetratricopeptide (TPR) repeat protein
MPAPTVFISYSHKDEIWKDRLLEHLGGLEEEGILKTWNDRDLDPGDEWFEEIHKAMGAADVAVFLVSASSLKSKFIRHKEIPRLLERRAEEGMVFFPVIVRSCLWKESPWLARFQVLPADDKSLADFTGNRRDKELAKIAKGILDIVRDGSKPPKHIEPSSTSTLGIALPSLHQLPSPPFNFTGRKGDLEALRSALAKGSTGTICLRGTGGIGKTALALKFATELKPHYPDAQLYLDLKGMDPQPLPTEHAMAHVIRSWHPEARLPESEAELAGLYRSVLDDKRALLLMDNAASREQVEPLTPPSGSLLLVTSRFHFALPGLVSRNLDELPLEDARNLLLKIAPRIDKEADVLAGLCGRLPLALRLAGSALAERPDLSPADYARRLKEGKERFGAVEAALIVSYKLLDKDRRRLWSLLAVFPSTFDAPAAAAVWELDADPASEALGDLVRSSLGEWEEKDERYRLHDLARSFADRQLAKTEREAAQRRHAEYFLELLWATGDLCEQGGESIGRALQLFDAEWGNVQAGFAWASSRFPQDETAARICDQFPGAGWYCLSLRQHPREQIRWTEFALLAARQRKDRRSEGEHLDNLGLAYADLGEPRRAIEHYEQALVIVRDIGDRRVEGQILGNLGLAYADLGETRRAIEHYEQALAISREIGDRRGESQDLGSLGLAYAALGETRRAIEHYEQWLAIARDIGDRREEGNAFGNLGNAYKNLGETRCAIEYYEQALTIDCDIGDRRGEAIDSWNLGLAIKKEGDLARAADLMQVCVDYEREIGHPDAEKDAAYVAALRARIAEQGA